MKGSRFIDRMNVILLYSKPDHLIDTFINDKDWTFCMFGKKTVQNYKVAAFFMKLIANGILVFAVVNHVPKVILQHDKKMTTVMNLLSTLKGFCSDIL